MLLRVETNNISKNLNLNEIVFLEVLKNLYLKSEFIRDNRAWIPMTYSEWHKIFPFWSERKIIRIIYRLEAKGILLSRNFYVDKRNRTKFYTIDFEKLNEIVGV